MEILDISLIPDGDETRVGEGKCQITVRHYGDSSPQTLYAMGSGDDDFLAQCIANGESWTEIRPMVELTGPNVVVLLRHESGKSPLVTFRPR